MHTGGVTYQFACAFGSSGWESVGAGGAVAVELTAAEVLDAAAVVDIEDGITCAVPHSVL